MNFKDRLLWHYFKIDIGNSDDRNVWYLVAEMFWASILGSVATFNAAYAIRLGANNFQVSLLSSIPALMAVLVSYPAAQFLERKAQRKSWVFGSLLVYRAGFLMVAVAPWLSFLRVPSGMMAVMILVMISAPAHFFNVGWIPMLAEVVPEQRRAAVFAARNIINQATVSVTVFLCGLWLSRVVFPINYQVMYVVGFLSSMLSMYCLYKMNVPASHISVVEVKQDHKPSQRERIRAAGKSIQQMGRDLTQHGPFFRITTNTLMHGFGVWMAAPLYALYFVKTLNASDAWLGLNGTLACIGTIVGFSLWRWLISRWGEPISLKRTIVMIGIYPMLVGLTPSLPVILVYGVLNGLVTPGVTLSHFNTLLSVMPPEARPRYTALYMTIMNIGAFICPLISVALSNKVGLGPMLAISGLLSVLGSTSFWWRPVHGVVAVEPPVAKETAPAA
jgi:MFS family permease